MNFKIPGVIQTALVSALLLIISAVVQYLSGEGANLEWSPVALLVLGVVGKIIEEKYLGRSASRSAAPRSMSIRSTRPFWRNVLLG